jgi:hypothetical protein
MISSFQPNHKADCYLEEGQEDFCFRARIEIGVNQKKKLK